MIVMAAHDAMMPEERYAVAIERKRVLLRAASGA